VANLRVSRDFYRQLGTRHRRRRVSRPLGSEQLESRTLLAAAPVISEFMAANTSTLQDEDGDYSDWIEILNAGDQPVDLNGYWLTDSASDLTGWRFPSRMLPPGEMILVFASGKDRDLAGGELHTNFRLSADGEYLALVAPNGQSVVQQFAPQYPPQIDDIAYGLAPDQLTETLLATGSTATYLVPQDDSEKSEWNQVGFDDGAWSSGTTGIGYETGGTTLTNLVATNVQAGMFNQATSLYVRIPFEVDDPAKFNQLLLNLQYDDGFVAYLNGVDVMRENAPGEDDELLAYNATATNSRPNSEVIQSVQFDISDARGSLQVGENILALHVLNLSAGDPDLLIRPELLGGLSSVDVSSFGYLTTPTPGDANVPVATELGPLVFSSQHSPQLPLANQPIIVTANVTPTLRNVASVQLVYRVMFGEETTIAMTDNGTGGDQTAGDGTYTATIPAQIAQPGEMVRWYVSATDSNQVVGRLPKFEVTSGRDRSPEYMGTLIGDPSVSSEIAVLHWWVENASAAGGRSGTHASLSYNGRFYDSVFVRQRGGSTASNPVGKTNFKFDFVGEQFVFDPRYKAVEEFNLNSTATDKAYIRQPLAFETYAAVGAPASISFPMHVLRNDEFYGVFVFIEEPDDEMLERNGLDDNGALYKIYNEFTSASGARKKTREHENNSDLADFVREVNRLEGVALRNYLFDNVNLPATLNYLVATVLTHQNDNPHKNHFLYRDSDGSGEWMFLPWDNDLTWGSNWVGTSFSDVIYADADNITIGPVPGHDLSVIHPSHPLINSEPYREWNNHWNRLMDALLQDEVIQQMFLRRLRTAMDELFGPPGTTDSFVDRRLNEHLATMGPDTALDKQAWANPRWRWGEDQTFAEAVEIIRNEYLEVRREHLYVTHSVDNLDPEAITVLLPEFAQARYFVPGNDNLGTSWTTLNFNDTAWATGETGIGFENSPRTFDPLIRTRVKPQETAADSNSIFIRIPFDVADPTQIEELTLRMKYDDGFVAYLNGEEVARARIRTDGTPAYDDGARANSNTAAISFENFRVTDHLDALVPGRNVLAIHGLNSSTTSSDMLVLPELIDGIVQTVAVAGIPHAQVGNAAISLDGQDYDVSPISGNQDEEYLRLNNPTAHAVDISDWRLTGGIEHTFRKGTIIPAGMSLYVSPNVSVFRARATGASGGQGLLVQGDYQGHLSNLGDVVHLLAADGATIDSLTTPANPTAAQQYLRVTELYYNPASLDDETEFVELTNISDSQSLDLSGVTLSEGPQQPFTLPAGTQLAAGQSLVIVRDLAAFQAAYPGLPAGRVFGPIVGNFSNQGERIKLDDALGNTIVDFEYGDNSLWPLAADGAGATLELIAPATPVDQLSKPYHWRHSLPTGGTPAAPAQNPLGVVINEIVSNPVVGQTDALELFNDSTTTVDLTGWSLTDAQSNYRKYSFPAGTTMAPGQYLTLNAQQLGFGFSGGNSDDAWLVRSDGTGQPVQFGDQVSFGASVVGESWGRFPNATGRLGTLTAPTLGAENANPRVGSVVISEVQYNAGYPSPAALSLDPSMVSNNLEFVELTNRAGTPLDLVGWQLRGGMDLDLAESTTLAPGQSLIVISFDPTAPENSQRLAAFRAHYGLDDSDIIRGGDTGQLNNSYDRVQLLRPGGTEADPDASEPLSVDEVVYDDLAPWPQFADGTGASLQRVSGNGFGNLAASWYAGAPTPGAPSFGGPRGDFNGDAVVNQVDIDLLFTQIRAAQPDPAYDLTGDGVVDQDDRDEMVVEVLRTTFGDSNLDGIFNSSDLVQVFAIGKYEDNSPLNAGWADGDWNGDGDFGTGDLVLAFQFGGYTAAAQTVEGTEQHPTLAAAVGPLSQLTNQRSTAMDSPQVMPGDWLRQFNSRRRWQASDRVVESLFADGYLEVSERSVIENELLDQISQSVNGHRVNSLNRCFDRG
jgi:hypothetical protein